MSEEKETEKTASQRLYEILKDIPESPDLATIDSWKEKYGDIYASGFSEQEVFIFRSLSRAEYQAMQVSQQVKALRAQQKEQDIMSNESLNEADRWTHIESSVKDNVSEGLKNEEEVAEKCLLWPKKTSEELSKKAGTINVLFEQIMQNSNFLTPQQAAALVIKL